MIPVPLAVLAKDRIFLLDIGSGAAVLTKNGETDCKVKPLFVTLHSPSFTREFSGVVEEVYDQSHYLRWLWG